MLRERSDGDAEADLAGADELLREVASGARGATLRLLVPAPAVAFGRRDVRAAGFGAARDAARAHGFAPVVRLAGGHAAAYDSGSLVVEQVVPVDGVVEGVTERFAAHAGMVVAALQSLGLDARIGELAGEYCPGAHSVNVAGRIKVAGVAQRVTRRAALVSSVVVVEGGDRIRAVIADVYAELGIAIDPDRTGAVQDVAPGIGVGAVADAIAAQA